MERCAPFVAVAAVIFVLHLRVQRRKAGRDFPSSKASQVAIGVDFGGTSMKLALVDARAGSLLDTRVVPIAPSREPTDVVQQIVNAASELLQSSGGTGWGDVVGLGVCCPGRVENGVVSTVANLQGWADVPLEKLLREKTGVGKVKISNDANAALAGEMWSGAATNCEDVVMITLGTGVGGAVASDGMILKGSTGMFGEVGHQIICANGRLNSATGVRGIAEEYCSARAIRQTWMDLSGEQSSPDPQIILDRAEAGSDGIARNVAEFMFEHVGILIVNCCRAYDPKKVILGGGLCSKEWVVQECRRAAHKSQWTLATPTYVIVRALHGNWAGTIGAAAMAIRFTK